MPGRARLLGWPSLVTFFGQSKKVTRPPAGGRNALFNAKIFLRRDHRRERTVRRDDEQESAPVTNNNPASYPALLLQRNKPQVMIETNPISARIDDLKGRVLSLRGYL